MVGYQYVGPGQCRWSDGGVYSFKALPNRISKMAESLKHCSNICSQMTVCDAFSWERANLFCSLYKGGPYLAVLERHGFHEAECYAKSSAHILHDYTWIGPGIKLFMKSIRKFLKSHLLEIEFIFEQAKK